MNVVFLGSGAFGVPTLQRLAHEHNIVGVVTQPDRKAGRGSKLTPTPIGQWAHDNLPDIPIIKPEKINESEVQERVRSWDADAWVVIAFGQYLSSSLIKDRFAINLHASLLPRWRGAAPINAAVIAGDQVTGNSVITIAKEMDAGQVLAQSTRLIQEDQTAGELHDLLASDGPELVCDVLQQRTQQSETYQDQDPSKVTVAPKMSKSDGVVDFTQSGSACAARINGLNPWPSVTVGFRDESIKLNKVKPAQLEPQVSAGHEDTAPGEIMDSDLGIVSCGDGTAIEILMVQPAGKRAMDWKAFANGRSVQTGERMIGINESKDESPIELR
jgi:methionyl-tRNA formyltransferase